MISFKPTKQGGRLLTARTPIGEAIVEWNAAGELVSQSIEIKTPRPPQPIPVDYDPNTSPDSPKRRGCCDPATVPDSIADQ